METGEGRRNSKNCMFISMCRAVYINVSCVYTRRYLEKGISMSLKSNRYIYIYIYTREIERERDTSMKKAEVDWKGEKAAEVDRSIDREMKAKIGR